MDLICEKISAVLLSVFFRSTCLLLVVGFVYIAFNKCSASLRHGVLAIGLAGLFSLPALQSAGPLLIVQVPIRQAPAAITPQPIQAPAEDAMLAMPIADQADSETYNSPMRTNVEANQTPVAKVNFWLITIPIVWMVGIIFIVCRLLLAHITAYRLTRQAASGALLNVPQTLLPQLNADRILVSDRIMMPMTWGIAPPIVLLPAESVVNWTSETLNAVLQHEAAHIRRKDWLTQLASEFARAIYWPHPLVWLLGRRMRLEAEIACDDA